MTVAIVGSVAWDEVVHLAAPLRAGAHNAGRSAGRRIGGGGANAAMAAARMGESPLLVAAVGDDPDGTELRARLEEVGVAVDRIGRDGGVTTRSLILLEPGGERTVVNLARARPAAPADLAGVAARVLYLRGDGKGLLPLLNAPHGFELVVAQLPGPGGIVPPAHLLVASASDLPATFLSAPFAHGRALAGEGLRWVVVTDGAGEVRAWSADGERVQPVPRVEVVDSTGAGDVFAAGLCAALARDASMAEALRRAVAWGSASVTYAGSAPPEGFPARVAVLLAALPPV